MAYEIYSSVVLQGVFTNALADVYADPASITLYLRDPTGAIFTYRWQGGSIIRDSMGHFQLTISPKKSGNWIYKWQGTAVASATSKDTTFTVNSSALIPDAVTMILVT